MLKAQSRRAWLVSLLKAATLLVLGLGGLQRGGPFAPVLGAVPSSIAFYYGPRPPMAELSHFDWVVVQPDHLDRPEALADGGVAAFAYVSVGEIEERLLADPRIDRRWLNGANANWGTRIVDLTQEGWQSFLVEDHLAGLWNRGYRGFFLDTLDSYKSSVKDPSQQNRQKEALISLIRRIHRRFPGVKLLFNRGFEILPEVSGLCSGLVSESLFAGWDPGRKRYIPVSEQDRTWLLERLREARDRYGIPVAVIDYVPPEERTRARDVAGRIQALGFIPWVANPGLDVLGVGSEEILPRRILALYDGQGGRVSVTATKLHRHLAPILEYLGYVPEYRDISETLPEESLAGQYLGIVTWLEAAPGDRGAALETWLRRQLDGGLKVAILGQPGFPGSREFLARLGLAAGSGKLPAAPTVQFEDARVLAFEAPVRPRSRGLRNWRADERKVRVHLSLAGAAGERIDPVVSGAWGGLALDPFVLAEGYGGSRRWIVNPFEFLKSALALPEWPVPDLTTEAGRRVALVSIDGTGAAEPAELPGTPPAASVIRDRILRPYALPATVSAASACPACGGRSATDALRAALGNVPGLTVAASGCEADADPVLLPPPAPAVDLDGGPFSLTQLLPLGRPDGGGRFRAYAPLPDDFAYTRQWQRPFDGYRRVIALMQATERPRRLRPVHINYHLLAGSKLASLEALDEVYRWAVGEGVIPLGVADYQRRVAAFQAVTLSRRLDGGLTVRGLQGLPTLRVSPALGTPDLARCVGVASVNDLPQGRYLNLRPEAGRAVLNFRTGPDLASGPAVP